MTGDEDRMSGIDRLLSAACGALGMDVSFISRIERDSQRFEYLSDAEQAGALGLSPWDAVPAVQGYCHHMLAGTMPSLVPDTRAHPVAAAADSPIGCYAGVPLRMADGRLYGTLCAVSRQSRALRPVDEEVLRVLAALVAEELAAIEVDDAARRRAVARFESFFAPGAIEVVLQPIVGLLDGRTSGLEALARFPAHREGPAAVFASAAALGVGVDLELAAVAGALEVLRQIPDPVYLSVNVSPAAVLDPRLPDVLARSDRSRVVVELTEHVPVADYPELLAALGVLRASGLRVAVDDTGSGFASLRHIVDVAPDVIKLDLGLIQGIDADPARRALARAMVAFAGELGAALVAEGIETSAELVTLQDLGVPFGQGYRLGRPLPLTALPSDRTLHTGYERRRSGRPWSEPASPAASRGEDRPGSRRA